MSRIILKATETNWGLIGPGSWDTSVWEVRNDMTFSLKTIFRSGDEPMPVMTIQGTLLPDDYEDIVQLINSPWGEESVDACDGTAWEFKAYGLSGELIKHRPSGYIYGIEPYESMAAILEKQKEEE